MPSGRTRTSHLTRHIKAAPAGHHRQGLLLWLLFQLLAPPQPRAADVVLQHLVGKGHQLLRCAVDLAQQPALHHTRAGDHINMRQQGDVIRGHTGLHRAHIRADLLHGAVDDGVDVRFEKALQMVPSHRAQGAQADGPVVLDVVEQLQLALSLDYAVILCNRFKEEHQTLPIREAAIAALSKAIPEISASSLTTVGGLCAMLFMQFKIGADMGVCLMKSILFALLAVFIVMPSLLVLFGPLIEKTEHRNFVPRISFVGKFAWATRKVIPFVFLGVIVLGYFISSKCPYAYGYSTLTTPKLNETQIAENLIDETFTSKNMAALIVPAGDYDKEAALLKELDAMDGIDYTMGLANVEAMDGYMLADKLTPRQFSELAGLDYEMAQVIYAAYATEQGDYGKLMGNISSYKVPLVDMFLFVCEQADAGIVQLDADQTAMLRDAKTQMESAKAQLQGSDHSRPQRRRHRRAHGSGHDLRLRRLGRCCQRKRRLCRRRGRAVSVLRPRQLCQVHPVRRQLFLL